jgi:hypothetical protein
MDSIYMRNCYISAHSKQHETKTYIR